MPETAFLALDLGGTKIAGGLVTSDGTVLERHTTLTDAEAGRDGILQRLTAAARHLVHLAGERHYTVTAVGVATPGLMDYATGRIRFATSTLKNWIGTELQQHMEDQLDLPCRIENDANAGAWAEYCWGAGRGVQDMLYISVGTGIGGGLVLGGRLIQGAVGGAGGFGHVSIDHHGPRCYCGNYGCVELYASGKAVAQSLRADNRGLPLAPPDPNHPEELREVRAVVELAAAGSAGARQVLAEMGDALGMAAASAANLVNPSLVVVGGGIVHAGQYLLEPMERTLKACTLPPVGEHVQLRAAQLGSEAGLLGAALVAMRVLGEPIDGV